LSFAGLANKAHAHWYGTRQKEGGKSKVNYAIKYLMPIGSLIRQRQQRPPAVPFSPHFSGDTLSPARTSGGCRPLLSHPVVLYQKGASHAEVY
jgi:hypothetical protein